MRNKILVAALSAYIVFLNAFVYFTFPHSARWNATLKTYSTSQIENSRTAYQRYTLRIIFLLDFLSVTFLSLKAEITR